MFKSEKLLVDSVIKNINPIYPPRSRKKNMKVLTEVDLGYGRADIVISNIKKQNSISNCTLDYFDVTIYRIIQVEKSVTLKKLQDITRTPKSRLNKTINKLIKESYIEETDSLIRFKKQYQGVAKTSIAIEAKLKDWRRALKQAFRYKWFAEEAIVILDSTYIKPAIKNIKEFQKLNVSLAHICSNGKITFHFRAEMSKPVDLKMNIILNEMLKTSLLRSQERLPNT